MKYIIWIYLANISNRFREFAINIFRLSLLALIIEYLFLTPHVRPLYTDHLLPYIDKTWLILVISFIMVLLPSDKLVFNIISWAKRDKFLRENIIIRCLRLLKYRIKHDLFNKKISESLYTRFITPRRVKYVYILLYLWDIYKGYGRLFRDVFYAIVAYFGFAVATWLYVRFTGSSIYYIHTVNESFALGVAIIGFLIFKIIFLPSWKTIQAIGLYILGRVVVHQLGIVKMEQALAEKLEKFEKPQKDN